MVIPEVAGKLFLTTVEQVDVVQHLVIVVVLGLDTNHSSLYAQIDVLEMRMTVDQGDLS